MEKEIQYLGHGPRGAGAALRGRPRAGPRSPTRSRSSRACCRGWTRCSSGGGMAYTFFRAQGLADRQEPRRGGQGRPRARICWRKARRQAAAARRPRGGRRRSRRTPRRRPLPVRRDPRRAGWASTSARPPRRAFASARRRSAKIVLWNGPMGVFEMEPFAEGTLAMAQRAGRVPGHHHRGRRRQRGGGHADGPRRQDHPRLDRRRRLPRVPGRRPPPGRRLPRRTSAAMRRPLIAGNWKMYKTAARGGGPRPRDPRGDRAGRDRARGAWSPRPSPRSPRWPRCCAASRVLLGAQNMHWEKEGAFTGEVSPVMLADARLHPRHPRPLRAPAALRRDRRGRRPQGAGPRSTTA